MSPESSCSSIDSFANNTEFGKPLHRQHLLSSGKHQRSVKMKSNNKNNNTMDVDVGSLLVSSPSSSSRRKKYKVILVSLLLVVGCFAALAMFITLAVSAASLFVDDIELLHFRGAVISNNSSSVDGRKGVLLQNPAGAENNNIQETKKNEITEVVLNTGSDTIVSIQLSSGRQIQVMTPGADPMFIHDMVVSNPVTKYPPPPKSYNTIAPN